VKDVERFKKFGSVAAFTLVESIVGLAILGVMMAAAYSLISNNAKAGLKIQVSQRFDNASGEGLSELRNMLSNTGNGTTGLCRTMSTQMNSGGVGLITINLPQSPDPFMSEWTATFTPDKWTPVPASACPQAGDSYAQCFTPVQAGMFGIDQAAFNRHPVFRFSIYPVDMMSGSQNMTALPLPVVNADAKSIGLLLGMKITYQSDAPGSSNVSEQFTLLWMGEFNCVKTISTTQSIIMSPSAIGSGSQNLSLTGGPQAFLFSSNVPPTGDILQGTFNITAYTRGIATVSNAGRRAATLDDAADTKTNACTEVQYRCPNTPAVRSWQPGIQANISARYNANNGQIFTSSVNVCPSASFSQGGQGSTPINTISNYFDETTNPPTDLSPTSDCSSPTDFYQLSSGTSREVRAAIDQADANACPQMCSDGNNYNATNPYTLSFNYAINDANQNPTNLTYTMTDSAPVGCICCAGKQCAAVGTQVNIWCSQQMKQPEPIDSRIPECTSKSAQDGDPSATNQIYAGLTVPANTALPANSCLAAYVQNGNLQLEADTCTTQLPVMCYSQGGFQIASSKGTLQTGKYIEAGHQCFNMSWETVSSSETNARLQQGGTYNAATLPTQSGGNYAFNDSALVGVFLAPQNYAQLADATAKAVAALSSGARFWIALRTDANQNIVSAPPIMDISGSQYVSYFDTNGLLNFAVDTAPLYTIDASPGSLALVHSRRYIGTRSVKPTGEPQPLSVLCYNPVTKLFNVGAAGTTQISRAAAICQAQGLVFYAPSTPLGWGNALNTLSPIDPTLPWPNPTTTPLTEAWVALDDNGNGTWNMEAPIAAPTTNYINGFGQSLTTLAGPINAYSCFSSGSYSIVTTRTACSGTIAFPTSPSQQMSLIEAWAAQGLFSPSSVIEIIESLPPTTTGGTTGTTGGTSGGTTS